MSQNPSPDIPGWKLIEYQEAFRLLAGDDNVLTFEKVAKFMCATARSDIYTKEDLENIVRGAEHVDFGAFLALMRGGSYKHEDRDVFDVFDHDCKGYIDSGDFSRIADAIEVLPAIDKQWGKMMKGYTDSTNKNEWWDLLMKYEDDRGVAMIDRAEFKEIMHTTEERSLQKPAPVE